jgi:hypothetical protein
VADHRDRAGPVGLPRDGNDQHLPGFLRHHEVLVFDER